MMKQEFEGIIDGKISDENYRRVEIVYVWYPGIESKEQIAEFYKIGMTLINDLLPRAKEIMDTDSKINELKRKLEELM